MIKVKALFFTLLICTGLIFNGELYVLYMNTFQASYYESDFYTEHLPETISDSEIKQDFINTGERHLVDFFVLDQTNRSVFKSEYVIYGTEGALQALKEKGIREGLTASLFFGETKVNFESFQDIVNIRDYKTYYFIGEDEKLSDIRAFKGDLIDRYGGGFPRRMGSERETQLNLLATWSIIFGIALLICLYSVLYQKKEIVVRIILGENPINIFLRNIVMDTGAYCMVFLLCIAVLQHFSYVLFRISFVIILFTGFLLINVLMNTLILHMNFKKTLSSTPGKGLLTASYCIKAVTTVLVTLVLATNIAVVQSSLNLYAQKDFFESHRNNYYMVLGYEKNDKTAEEFLALNQKFYQRFQEKAFIYADLSENLESNYPVILTNRKSLEELAIEYSNIEKAVEAAGESSTLLLVPSNITTESDEYHYGKEIAKIFGDARNQETVFYTPEISLSGIHGVDEYKMILYKNPIVVCNRENLSTEDFDKYENGYYYHNIMYQVSPQEYKSFISEYSPEKLTLSKSNVLSVYEESRRIASLELKLVLVLSAFLLLLEMTLIIFIIRMEYRLNSIELVLKKVHGYSLAARNKTILKTAVFSSIFGIAAAWIVSRVLYMRLGIPLIIAGAVLILLEVVYIFWRAKKTEARRITSILKGEKI